MAMCPVTLWRAQVRVAASHHTLRACTNSQSWYDNSQMTVYMAVIQSYVRTADHLRAWWGAGANQGAPLPGANQGHWA